MLYIILIKGLSITAQRMKFFIWDFFNKCDRIQSFLRVWSHLLKKSLMENFIFCAVYGTSEFEENVKYKYKLKLQTSVYTAISF